MNIRILTRWALAMLIALAALIIAATILHSPLAQAHRLNSSINCSGSIQACIDSATDGDTIVIAAGDYTESLTLNKAVSLTGVNSATTIIHAMPSDRVLTVTGATITNSVVISGLTFTGGNTNYGGGIYSTASLILIRSRFISNSASDGGGLYINGEASLIDTDFISNTAFDGGGVAIPGVSTITLIGGRFEHNSATTGLGGGLSARYTSLQMSDTVFISNTVGSNGSGGGAIAASANIGGGRFENNSTLSHSNYSGGGLVVFGPSAITGTQFINNSGGYGGGLYAGDVTLNHTSFISNSAWIGGGAFVGSGHIMNSHFEGNRSVITDDMFGGGAIYAFGSLAVTGTEFVNNTSATNGGGIFIFNSTNNTIVNTLFTHNAASENGAALYAHSTIIDRPSITLLHNTIADVMTNSSSAIAAVSGTLGITDTIIANHAIAISTTAQASVYEDYNLFYNNITDTLGSIVSGGHSLIGDPKFVDPANDDYHLGPDSAAIDQGVDAGVTTDLDGHPRPIGAGFDIGAYEAAFSIRYVTTNGIDTSNDCADSTNPCATVQHAIDVADDNNEIRVATGVYTDVQSRNSITQVVYISKTIALRGGYTTTNWLVSEPVNNQTTLDARRHGRVITIIGNISPTVEGFTITGGDASGLGGDPVSSSDGGGGIDSIDAVVTLTGNVIISNVAMIGGGIYAIANNFANSRQIIMQNNVVTDNFASAAGGINIEVSVITISNNVIANNRSIVESGGLRTEGSSGSLIGNTIVDNTSGRGGGIWIDESAYVTIRHNIISRNHATGPSIGGGGIVVYGVYITINDNIITENTAHDGGGGIYTYDGAFVSMSNNVVARNQADNGLGNGIYDNIGISPIYHLTLADNGQGSGILFAGSSTIDMKNVIVSNQSIGIAGGSNVHLDGVLWYSNTQNTSGSINVTQVLTGDPKFVDPANDDYHLGPNSAAIDQGVDAGVTTDLDGNPRDSKPDIGAYEFIQVLPISGLTASNNSPTHLGSATTFTATVISGTQVAYQWNFGDGQLDSHQVTTHTYNHVGAYTAVVTATNSGSGPFTATTVVTVIDVPISGLSTSNNSPTTLHNATTFTATIGGGTNISYTWNFGDSGSSSTRIASHTYAAIGTYVAVVTATNSASGPITATTRVTITDIPINGLSAINNSPNILGASTRFTATVFTGTSPVYQWNYGDGQLGSGAVTTHIYTSIGRFMAIVTASNGSSGPITATTIVTITDAPIVGLSAINNSPTLIHHSTFFTATVGSGSNILYRWNFGDGVTSTSSSLGTIAHTYTTYGVYTATVTTTNSISTSIANTIVLITPYRLYLPLARK